MEGRNGRSTGSGSTTVVVLVGEGVITIVWVGRRGMATSAGRLAVGRNAKRVRSINLGKYQKSKRLPDRAGSNMLY